ncbi:MMPL family transporter [Nocardia sp. NPDC051321]|uniref:MMPL family transporter n=1 Tax=Nocardia sp. NPDC051321 TaxID=3364323 RepID=UPI0037AD6B5A
MEYILIRASDGGRVDEDRARAVAGAVTARMMELPEVEGVAEPVRSADGSAVRVAVTLRGPELKGKTNVVPLLAQTATIQAAHPYLVVEQTGSASISKGVNAQRGADLALSERISIPITLLTLLVVFGSVVIAGVPVLLALSAISAAVGLNMLVSHLVPDAGVGTNMILLIGLAVGVDYTLFYVEREREERARSGGRLSAEALVELASRTAGRTIAVSGIAVIASTAMLYFASDVIFSSLATGTILVVAVAVASSMTALPALLVWIGRRAERRAARGKVARRERPELGFRTAPLLRVVQRRPGRTLGVSLLLMLVLAAPMLGLKLMDAGRDTFSREIPAMQVYDRLTGAFPELLVKHEVVVRNSAEQQGEVRAALSRLNERAQADSLFAVGAAAVRTAADGRTSVLELPVPHPAQSREAIESLRKLRADYIPATIGRLSGVETAVSGDVARGRDYVRHEREILPLVVGLLLLVTFVMTVLVFRAVVIGLLGVVCNLLSAAAALGLMTLVFQGTWAEALLDFDSRGAIVSRVPLFLFVILFGLSTDYQVFVLSRIREARERGLSSRAAVLEGIGRSAKVITSAAVVMVTVFGGFVALQLTEMKQMGFCLAVAVLLDAVVIRMLVLPAALLLLGDRAWWMPRRRRPAAALATVG